MFFDSCFPENTKSFISLHCKYFFSLPFFLLPFWKKEISVYLFLHEIEQKRYNCRRISFNYSNYITFWFFLICLRNIYFPFGMYNKIMHFGSVFDDFLMERFFDYWLWKALPQASTITLFLLLLFYAIQEPYFSWSQNPYVHQTFQSMA